MDQDTGRVSSCWHRNGLACTAITGLWPAQIDLPVSQSWHGTSGRTTKHGENIAPTAGIKRVHDNEFS